MLKILNKELVRVSRTISLDGYSIGNMKNCLIFLGKDVHLQITRRDMYNGDLITTFLIKLNVQSINDFDVSVAIIPILQEEIKHYKGYIDSFNYKISKYSSAP